MEFLIVWVAFSLLVYFVAEKRDRSGIGWFVVSLFITPLLSIIILLVIGDSGDTTECDACAEKVKAEAKVCKHCGASLTPLSEIEKMVNVSKPPSSTELFCTMYEAKKKLQPSLIPDSMREVYEAVKAGSKVDDDLIKYEINRLIQ